MIKLTDILRENSHEEERRQFFDSIKTFKDIKTDDQIRKFISYLGSEGYNNDDDAFEDLKYRIAEYHELPNPVKLYRIVGVIDKKVINRDELGSHWTTDISYYDDNFMELIGVDSWDEDAVPYMITAIVPHDRIDIPETIYNNLTYPRENKIFVTENGRGLDIVNIERWDI